MRNLPIITADVDLVRGVEEVTNRLIPQIKGVTVLLFTAATVVALALLCFYLTKTLLAHRRGDEHSWTGVILSAIGLVVCAIFASGTQFFDWFGL